MKLQLKLQYIDNDVLGKSNILCKYNMKELIKLQQISFLSKFNLNKTLKKFDIEYHKYKKLDYIEAPIQDSNLRSRYILKISC